MEGISGVLSLRTSEEMGDFERGVCTSGGVEKCRQLGRLGAGLVQVPTSPICVPLHMQQHSTPINIYSFFKTTPFAYGCIPN